MRSVQERYSELRSRLRALTGQQQQRHQWQQQYREAPVDGPMTRSLSEGLGVDTHIALEQDSEGRDELVLESPRIPQALVEGVSLLRITRKKKVQRVFKVDLDRALVTWSGKAVSLDRIQQIRVRDDARNYREEYGVSKELDDRWCTILYKHLSTDKLKALHLLAPSSAELDLFVNTVEKLVTRRRQLMRCLAIPDENFAHIHWKNYVAKDPHSRQFLSFDDVLKLTRRLHINCDEEYLRSLFSQSDSTGKGALNFEEFQKFVKQLKQRPEIKRIFDSVATDGTIKYLAFNDFVVNVQRHQHHDIKLIFDKFTQRTPGQMTIDGFTDYLTSSHVPATTEQSEDLSHPLNEYFISSSHNTYLLGRQYGQSTSIEGYIRALQRGCRSVEIDIWSGDSGPIVTHGKITSSISLRDVLEIVKKYAFIVTPFPLFLSLEIHCKPLYQHKVKELLVDILGDMLITQSTMPRDIQLPSPMDLKHKILIKVKKTSFDDLDSSQSSFTSSSTTTTTHDDDDDELTTTLKLQKKKRQFQIVPDLSAMGVYAQGLKFVNFSLPESKQVNHIFSFSDRNFRSMIKDPERNYLIKKHNRKFLMRVYPAGYRYNSSNFSPIVPWMFGTQMVATNWQTFDLGQQVNEAMFNCGSKCGYKLKPPQLRNTDPVLKLKPKKDLELHDRTAIKFSIDIISGQLLPRPKELKPEDPLNPYVMLELIDSSLSFPLKIIDIETSRVMYNDSGVVTTKSINSNGFNPLWNCRVEGQIRDNYGLNFVRFMIKTGEVPIAVNCFKLDNMNQGYIHIPLNDLQGEEYIFSTLFIKMNYETITLTT